jgi:hypothetical protein
MAAVRTVGSSRAAIIAGGLALALVPSSVLGLVAGEAWEVDLVRFSGVLVVTTGLLWGTTMRRGGDAARHMGRWVLGAWLCGGGYLVFGRPLLLVLSFSLLVGATLDSAVELAHISSENLLRRLDASGKDRAS